MLLPLSRSDHEAVSGGDYYVNRTPGTVFGVDPLPHINWIAEYPAALETQVVFPGFDAVHARFGGAVYTGVGIFPDANDLPILDQADFCWRRQMRLQSYTALDTDLIAHDDALLKSPRLEDESARRSRQVIAHEAPSSRQGGVDHFPVGGQVACQRLGDEDVRVHSAEVEIIREDHPVDGSHVHIQRMSI